LRDSLRATTGKARALLSARDAWLAAGRESLMVWTGEGAAPLSFGDGAALMEACLTGPDANSLSTALDALSTNGNAFTLLARSADGRAIKVRGRPAGGSVAVFLEVQAGDESPAPDFRSTLDALPIPIWLRRASDLALTFAPNAISRVPRAETMLP
jgi:hypothetical protein